MEINLAEVLIQIFGPLFGNIYANFLHDLDSKRVDRFGFQTGAEDFESGTGMVAQKGFRHLAAGGVSGAQE